MNERLHPTQLRPGDYVRQYRLVRRLGKGGFSLVFLAEYGGHHFALKIALQPASDEDEDHTDGWMRREAISLEHLVHPNLLPVHELGRWPHPRTGYTFFVTEHVPGSTFREWCLQGPVTHYQWVRVLCEVLRPLEAMHARGMCHRDLKADNILVRAADDWPFLIDFGAVHLPGARPLTEGLAPGTLHCQPPEAVRFVVDQEVLEKGSRFEARPSADLYALGVILYEALTGHHPFDPKLPVEQLLVAILTVEPADPRRLNPQAPDSLSELTLRLLAKDPEQRPSSARAVREELERLHQEEGRTPAWRAPCVPFARAPESAHPRVKKAPPETKCRRNRLTWWALGLGLLGLVGWALLLPLEQGSPVRSRQTQEPLSTLCALLSVTVAQSLGCATTPAVRPDPVGYLQRCSPEARATPVRLGFYGTGPLPYLYASYLRSGTSASSLKPIKQGGPLNIKAGPVLAMTYPYHDRRGFLIEGVAVTTKMRVYMQFDRIQGPDGQWHPICGVAVSTAEDVYGDPTRDAVQWPDSPVEPAMVDHSPGSVVLNDPQFMTFIQPPPGSRLPKIDVADPNAKADIEFPPR